MKRLLVVAALMFFTGPVRAEPVMHTTSIFLQPIPCTGIQAGKRYYIEDYINTSLPETIYITQAKIWVDGVQPIGMAGSNWVGNISVGIDVQSHYAIEQNNTTVAGDVQPKDSINLVNLQLQKGGQKFAYENKTIQYNSGDILGVAPECMGLDSSGNLTSSGDTISSAFLILTWYTNDAIVTPATIMTVQMTDISGGTGTFSMRSVVPPATSPFTQVRAYVQNISAGQFENIANMSACVRVNSTSDCVDTPIQMSFGGTFGDGVGTGYKLQAAGQSVWTDWTTLKDSTGTPITVTPPQQLLITSTILNPPGAIWPLSHTGVGYGNYVSFFDSTLSKSMIGTTAQPVVWQPNRTQVISSVQVR